MQGTRTARRARPTTAARRLRGGVRAALAVVAAAALAACSGPSAPVVAATDATGTTPPASATTTSGPTTTEPTREPTTGTPATPTARPTATPTTTPTTVTSTRPTIAPSPSPTDSAAGPRTQWPRALGEPTSGGQVWAVYLATGHSSSDAGIDRAVADAAAVGYDAVVGDLACDQGAIAALGLNQHDFWSAATIYFATESDVNTFLASYRARVGEVVGYARVSLGCLD